MALDAATIEWIRRLPDEPDSSDVATLRVLRRTASAPSDIRLLDSLLNAVNEVERSTREDAIAEHRLRILKAQQTTDGQDHLARERARVIKRLTQTLQQNERLSPAAAQQRAEQRLQGVWAEQDRRIDEEVQALKARSRGSVKSPSG
jgi:hypothetical protein